MERPFGPAFRIVSILFPLFLPLNGKGDERGTIYMKRGSDGVPIFTDAPTTPDFIEYMRRGISRSGYRINLKNIDTFDRIIMEEAERSAIDPYLVKAVMAVESGFNPKAISPRGARGLMQIMPELGKTLNLKDPFDPEKNIQCGIRHLKYLLKVFNNDVSLALAGYNAGEKAVRDNEGIPPYEETLDYVRKVHMVWDSLARKGGLKRDQEGEEEMKNER